jgi:hypothetical protein
LAIILRAVHTMQYNFLFAQLHSNQLQTIPKQSNIYLEIDLVFFKSNTMKRSRNHLPRFKDNIRFAAMVNGARHVVKRIDRIFVQIRVSGKAMSRTWPRNRESIVPHGSMEQLLMVTPILGNRHARGGHCESQITNHVRNNIGCLLLI